MPSQHLRLVRSPEAEQGPSPLASPGPLAPSAASVASGLAPSSGPSDHALERLTRAGEQLCDLVGLPTGDAVAQRSAREGKPSAVFRVAVAGALPDRPTTRLLTRRLARRGWSGDVRSETPVWRVEASRADLDLVLTASAGRLVLELRGEAADEESGPDGALGLATAASGEAS